MEYDGVGTLINSLFFSLSVNAVYMYFFSWSIFTLFLRGLQIAALMSGYKNNLSRKFLSSFIVTSNILVLLYHSFHLSGKTTPLILTFLSDEEVASSGTIFMEDLIILCLEGTIIYFSTLLRGDGVRGITANGNSHDELMTFLVEDVENNVSASLDVVFT